jgi:hypothetical protein
MAWDFRLSPPGLFGGVEGSTASGSAGPEGASLAALVDELSEGE